MEPGRYDLEVDQGRRLYREFLYEPASGAPDLTAWSGRAAISTRAGAGGRILLEASTTNGRLTLGPAGAITLDVPADVTAELEFAQARWDLVITPPAGGDDAAVPVLEGWSTLRKTVRA